MARSVLAVALAAALAGWSAAAAQKPEQPSSVDVPAGAVALEGTPTVRIDAGEAAATRQVLTTSEAARARLRVEIVDGKYYWTSRGNRRLQLVPSGDYMYLASEPGHYIRITRLNDRLSYVEHVASKSGWVSWWGELKVVVRE